MKHKELTLDKAFYRRFILTVALMLILPASVLASKTANDSLPVIGSDVHKGGVGLVLSGGGAKGIAHVGVIKALEENNIPIDYVVGTSMGAVIGSFYACGMTPEEMMALIKSKDFTYWSTGNIDPNKIFYFDKPFPTPSILNLNFNFRDSTEVEFQGLRANLINPTPMNFEFMKLFSPFTAQCKGDFDKLFVPFRCVYSDVYHKHKVVGRSGSLGDNVRASMSFPFVYSPIEMNGVLVYDGVIYDNFPVDVMHEVFDPGIMIGVSVSGPDGPPEPGNAYSQLEDMIIQNNDYSLPPEQGIKMQVPVRQFNVLAFDKADVIYEIGYRTALEMMDSIKQRVRKRVPEDYVDKRRKEWKAATPDVRFNKVHVDDAQPPSARYVAKSFISGNDTINMDQAEDIYYKVMSSGKIEYLLPTAMDIRPDGLATLDIDVREGAPFKLSAGGWLTSSVNSMLYASASYHNINSGMFEGGISGWLGQSYGALSANARVRLNTHVASALRIEGVVSRKKFYSKDFMFYSDDNNRTFSSQLNFFSLSYERAIGWHWKGYVKAGYSFKCNHLYGSEEPEYVALGRDKAQYHTWKCETGVSTSTLNNLIFPTSGREIIGHISASAIRARYLPHCEKEAGDSFKSHALFTAWGRYRRYFPLHGTSFIIGTMAEAAVTVGPLWENFASTKANSNVFAPTPTLSNLYNYHLRSRSYIALGVIPVWNPVERMQVRADVYCLSDIRSLKDNGLERASYKGWFRTGALFTQVSGVINFPFASLMAYGNYLTHGGWNFGVALGLFFEAPSF